MSRLTNRSLAVDIERVVKAKFHYAIQVAALVSDLSQTGSSYLDMSRYVEPVCDPKSRKLVANPHELVESRDHVCDLDSVMEFGLFTLRTTEMCCVLRCIMRPCVRSNNKIRVLYVFYDQ